MNRLTLVSLLLLVLPEKVSVEEESLQSGHSLLLYMC